jgi:phosphohistidine phosphatase SixA
MKTHFGILATVLAVVIASSTLGAPPDMSIVAQLQKGGYVLFMRHGKTNPDQADTDPLHLDNVQAQRQLTDEGRQQARDVGAAFRALKIPIGTVTCSKFYRAQEMAKLLGFSAPQPSVDVSEGGQVVTPRENQRRAQALRDLLSTPPAEGSNHIIVSHKPNLQDTAGKEFGDMSEAEVAIFRPLGAGKFEFVARVAPASIWTDWAK